MDSLTDEGGVGHILSGSCRIVQVHPAQSLWQHLSDGEGGHGKPLGLYHGELRLPDPAFFTLRASRGNRLL